MCGRFALHTPASFIAKRYFGHEKPVGDLVSRYNIAPGTQILSICLTPDHAPRFDLAFWGFRPAWAKESAPTPIKARIEKLRSPYYRQAFTHHRCVVPADGWFEWVESPAGKQPYYITAAGLARDETLMFAGIYTPSGTGVTNRVAIITEPAAEEIRHIHDRQPVVLSEGCLDDWLNPELTDTSELKGRISRVPGSELTWYPVSQRVNNPRETGKDLIEPIEL